MYTIITIDVSDGNLRLECYGPYEARKDAIRDAELIQRPCIKLIEFLWGKIGDRKHVA